MIDNRFEKIEEIGKGGFGVVYKCEDTQESEIVAIKMCNSDNINEIKRFKREVRLLDEIKQKNVINVKFKNFDHDPIYFVMPLAKCNLIEYLLEEEYSEEELINLFIDICEGVNSIHLSKQVHRDINPNNILIMDDEEIKISDLGLGKFEERDSTVLTRSDIYMGTKGYIPPEFKKRSGTKNADKRSDIFQLGKTLYYMLTKKSPLFIEKNILDPRLEYVILKSIKENPEKRYQNVSEFVDALSNYLSSLDPENYPIISIDSEIDTLKEDLKNKTYSKNTLENIIKYLYSLKKDTQVFLNKFDSIPDASYEIFLDQIFDEFKEILQVYSDVLKDFLENHNYSFSYAETIARKMKRIYYNTLDNELKSIALKNILYSSVRCNRWAAMDVFDSILINIKDDTEAYIISEMLKENSDLYSHLYDRINRDELHPEIQVAWEKFNEN